VTTALYENTANREGERGESKQLSVKRRLRKEGRGSRTFNPLLQTEWFSLNTGPCILSTIEKLLCPHEKRSGQGLRGRDTKERGRR